MRIVSYVRTEIIPEQAPPPNSMGLVGWARANLFSSWFNSILTVISVYLIYIFLINLIPWILTPTWKATSLKECREINTALTGHHSGACWGVITERWPQFIFGFYDREILWRPILVFLLFLATIAPILFERAPRRLLYLAPVFPFLAVWLLWGGSVWSPVSQFLGLVFGYLIWLLLKEKLNAVLVLLATLAGPIMWWLFCTQFVSETLSGFLPFEIQVLPSRDFGGLLLSLTIGLTAIFGSLPLGILLALGRQSDLLIVKVLCVWFIEFIRGVPLITLLFVASTLLNIFMPPGTNFDIIMRVVIMVTLFSSAYMAEVIRGGLAGLPNGQYEAANALGLSYWKAQRLIIMPQALKISIPGIVSNFIGVLKDTTLVSVIGLFDPIGLTTVVLADMRWNGVYWELNVFVAACFFIFCFSMSRYSMYLERKLRKEN